MAEEKPAPKSASGGDDNIFGALCYIIAILVPLFVLFTDKKSNKLLAFHAWQSLLLTVVWIVLWFGLTAVTLVASVVTMGVGGLLGCLFIPLMLVMVIIVLLLAYKAYLGEKYKLPIIGNFAEKQAGK
jgi:uncharacterized membrane protein